MTINSATMALACALLSCGVPAQAADKDGVAASMNVPGPEGAALAARAGLWDVVETYWPQPGAAPQTTQGEVAERRMVGLYLQETLHPAPGDAQVARIDYLGYNRVTGRWEYLSMDTRVAAGLMPAWSYERDSAERIRVQFEPFAFPRADGGGAVTGQLLRMEQFMIQSGPDAETKDQYFILADGSGTRWLAHRYAYRRRR